MLDASPRKIHEYRVRYGFEFWQLRTPLTGNRIAGVPWALDNGAFTRFDRPKWERMLEDAYRHRPVFVTLPDIVGDAARTLDLFDAFKRQTNGLPRALVLQEGIERFRIPWDDLAAVFVGGGDAFKTSQAAINCAKVAKILGKWVHVGRVNTSSRLRQWLEFADSIDGSGVSRFDHMLEDVLKIIQLGDHQGDLLS